MVKKAKDFLIFGGKVYLGLVAIGLIMEVISMAGFPQIPALLNGFRSQPISTAANLKTIITG